VGGNSRVKRTRLSACLRKVRYATFTEAADRGRADRQRAYRCDKCRHYHLTSRRRA
jgi:hypothetical protein